MDLTTDDTLPLPTRLTLPLERRQRGFWLAFGCALAFHALFLVAIISRSSPEHFAGAENGSNDAIAVEIVTEADLKSRETVAVPPAGGAPALKPSVEPQPQPQPQQERPAPPPPEPAKADPAPAPPEPTQSKETAASPSAPLVPDLADLPPPEALDAAVKPAEAKKEPPAETKEKPEAEKKEAKPKPPAKQKQANLNLAPPPAPPVTGVGPGRAAGASRPPGITRSGENDEFGRNVIRALRATMPPHSGVFGRVTVRLLLNTNGDLVEVRVLEPSGKSNLDQSVVFSTKQAYFPLPPTRSTELDRTFIISYVYR